MGQLRTMLETVQRQLGRLTATQRLLIGSLAVVMTMALFLVQQYAADPVMVAVAPGATTEEQAEVQSFLEASLIEHQVGPSGELLVPATQRHSVIARLAQSGKLPSDNRLTFDNLVERSQSWRMTNRQQQQMALIARQNELARVVAQMDGVQSAKVIMDVPDRTRIGEPQREPTASVVVFARGGVSQDAVNAIAALVASSTAGLEVESVRVVDGVRSRQLRAQDDGIFTAASYMEWVAGVEQRKRRQLETMLSYIPNVIVTVHAQGDVRREVRTDERIHPEDKGSVILPKRTREETSRIRQGDRAAEPGVRANTQADIALRTGGVVEEDQSTTETEYDTFAGRETRTVEDPGGRPEKINAVISIPRSYVALAMQQASGNEAAEPDAAALEAAFESLRTDIVQQVQKIVDTSSLEAAAAGEVHVSMYTEVAGIAGGASASLFGGGGGAPGLLPVGDLVKTVGIGGLAVLALGLVVVTALRSSRREPLPTAAELVGVPPALDDDMQVFGEAQEADSPLAGVELSEDDLRARKVLDQVTAMVNERPDQAATVLGRWLAETQ